MTFCAKQPDTHFSSSVHDPQGSAKSVVRYVRTASKYGDFFQHSDRLVPARHDQSSVFTISNAPILLKASHG